MSRAGVMIARRPVSPRARNRRSSRPNCECTGNHRKRGQVYRCWINLARMGRGLLAFAAGIALSAPLAATSLTVRVVDASGKPVRDAVVSLYPSSGAKAARSGGHYVVSQQNIQFHPFLTIVPVGADVSFPNLDNTKHHVYSFSAAKRFELKLFAKDQSRTVHFDKPGVVALGCNIHDAMSAFIYVTDSVWTARTNARGIATFADAPNAPGRVTVWHPYLRAPGPMQQAVAAATQRNLGFQVKLRP